MRTLEINLATRPFRNNTLYWAGFGSAVLALAAVSVMNVWLFLGYGSTMRRHQEDLSSKQQRREALARDERQLSVKLTQLDFKGLSQQSEFANDAIRRRIFSWTELFNRMEEVVPPAVMMISIRPEIQAEGISVVAEGSAKDQEGLLQFEENLLLHPRFARLYPGSERREQRGQDLRFSLKFDYVPDSRPRPAAPAPASKEPEPPGKEPAAPGISAPLPAVAGAGAAPASDAAGAKAPEVPPVAAPLPPPVVAAAPVRPPETSAVPPAGTAVPAAPSASPPVAAPPAAGQGAAAQQRPVTPPQQARPRGGGRRPPMKPGAMGRSTARAGGAAPAVPAPVKEAGEEGAYFANRPLQDVFDYLMKNRGMTFVFAGDFDFRQNVFLDLRDKDEREILVDLSKTLDCVVTHEGKNAYRLSPRSGGESLEEPPVEEEPAPADDGGQDAGEEARDPGQEPAQDPMQDPGQEPAQDPGQEPPR